jgi:hypothetical protein
MKSAPDAFEIAHGDAKAQRVRGENGRRYGAGGGAGDDRKRATRLGRQQVGKRLEHADLVGRTRAAARQDKAQLRRRALLVGKGRHAALFTMSTAAVKVTSP